MQSKRFKKYILSKLNNTKYTKKLSTCATGQPRGLAGHVGIDPLGLEERGPIVVATLELGVQRKKKYLLGKLALICWRYGTGGCHRHYRGAAVVKKIK